LLQDGDLGISIFLERDEILVGFAGDIVVMALQFCARELQVR
jgi:hypothetical protein